MISPIRTAVYTAIYPEPIGVSRWIKEVSNPLIYERQGLVLSPEIEIRSDQAIPDIQYLPHVTSSDSD